MLYNVLLIILIVVSVAMIVLILMQQGKGADAGAAFGSGASGTVFGSQGSANFLSRTTGILATVFFLVALALAFLASGRTIESGSIMGGHTTTPAPAAVETAPAAPASDVPPAPTVEKSSASDVPVAPVEKNPTEKPVEAEKPVQEQK
ncbi:preprotein translocase subunit SecG [Thiothrix litoralis]|uniref:Protein-export membrane protein SecG n=2 Tax=Thiothrix litoralis TaxID=2891210 RepID=A0ABX7WME8_9GAMM|nr:preprotein translocase subunit SecG [Thiothrix litoralis]